MNAGPARFLTLSLNYGSKGYRFSPVDLRERNAGVDLGLNMAEILTAIGVREDTWWGLPLLKFFTYYRLEYTAAGAGAMTSTTGAGPGSGRETGSIPER